LKIRVAIASQGLKGLDDVIPQVFGRSPAFTIVDVEDNMIKEVKTEKNPSADASHGAGPLTCMRLSKLGVNVVIAGNFGPSVLTILKETGIKAVAMSPGTKVKDAIQKYLSGR
jgi:predicted Fe-Mo cluster-binding NifX family protein